MTPQEKEPYEVLAKNDEIRYTKEVRQDWGGLTTDFVFIFFNTHAITVLPCHQMDEYNLTKANEQPQYHVAFH